VAGAFLKHSLQIVSQGLQPLDGLEQFYPQALAFATPTMACPPATLDKVKSQQTEEDHCEGRSQP
jgi:hypothetical protein